MEKDSQLSTCEKDIKKFVRKLKRKEIYFCDIPEEYRMHPVIVKTERALGIRTSCRRGYNVIQCKYFVEEIVLEEDESLEYVNSVFSDFASYYEFLEGDIYENACYFQHGFSQTDIATYSIDINRINTIALIAKTVSNFTIEDLEKELHYNDEEIKKENIFWKKWIDKFNSCITYEKFEALSREFINPKLYIKRRFKYIYKWDVFFIYNLISINKEIAFDIIMEYLKNNYMDILNVCGLCSIYDADKILSVCNYDKKKKGRLRHYIKCLNNDEIIFKHHSYFEENTGLYVHYIEGYESVYLDIGNRNVLSSVFFSLFKTFDELAEYLNNDLSGCDLSKAKLPNIDFSLYKIDENTKLPVQDLNELTYSYYKGYDRKKDCFVVKQSWIDKYGKIIKEHKDSFDYFFDFVYFLNNDLSNADLLFCDGLDNLCDFSKINLKNARLRSSVLDKLGEKYSLCPIDNMNIESFSLVIKNEEETADSLILKHENPEIIEDSLKSQRKICYVSDLHLEHRIRNAKCKSENDVLYVVQRIIDRILDDCSGIILIGGDTASYYSLFCFFIRLLRKSIDERGRNISVIFLIGNHELWSFSEHSFEETVRQYADVIEEQKMHMLQNNIIYYDDFSGIQKITTNELISLSGRTIRERLTTARFILFGGLAFSGYNETFNANNGIYRHTIDRKQEIDETKEFEKLYKTVCETLSDKKVIIFTHTPQSDWNSNNDLQSEFIYVSGHTHRNYFYDNGKLRIYADNQIGYKDKKIALKYFYVEDDYDLFSEYDDGIYEITKKQYIDFYRGKNIQMQFTRDINVLYMLKKNGYYCFIHQSEKEQLAILNGGMMKNLDVLDINYYYNKMDIVIAYVRQPLEKYTSIQKQISNEIKSIGGKGSIHGAIIDIDFYNHIYLNPYDLTYTGYWAQDMVDKRVFPSIPELLETNCPILYAKYVKQINEKSKNALIISNNTTKKAHVRSARYLETDIYNASREICRMQKINANILCEWYEPIQKMLE